jgi:hypothetical protein
MYHERASKTKYKKWEWNRACFLASLFSVSLAPIVIMSYGKSYGFKLQLGLDALLGCAGLFVDGDGAVVRALAEEDDLDSYVVA